MEHKKIVQTTTLLMISDKIKISPRAFFSTKRYRMMTVRPTFIVFAWMVFLLPQQSYGDVVFSISKVTPNPISKGSSAVFEVLARTNSGMQNFAFITLDLSLSRSDGVGGVFTTFSNYIKGPGWFLENNTKAIYDGVSGNGISSLSTSATAIGSITLSAADAIVLPGEYSMSISNINMDDGVSVIVTSAEGPLSYSITSVPEPSTVLLVSTISLGAVGARFRRWFSRSR